MVPHNQVVESAVQHLNSDSIRVVVVVVVEVMSLWRYVRDLSVHYLRIPRQFVGRSQPGYCPDLLLLENNSFLHHRPS